jgi:hypothetical protein
MFVLQFSMFCESGHVYVHILIVAKRVLICFLLEFS